MAAQLDARTVNSRDARGFGTRTRKNEGERKKKKIINESGAIVVYRPG